MKTIKEMVETQSQQKLPPVAKELIGERDTMVKLAIACGFEEVEKDGVNYVACTEDELFQFVRLMVEDAFDVLGGSDDGEVKH